MKNAKLKVMTIVGTRPEIIRLSRIIALLEKHCRHILVHTGQNYDYELNEIFFKELAIRKPDYFLAANTESLGKTIGDIIAKSEAVMQKEQPDALVILGDTNSSLSGIIARRLKIPIYHLEAGNRCFDFNVPEEINRRIIDHISDFNLVYTEHARRNLTREGIEPRKIYLTGSPLKEVIAYYLDKIEQSDILKTLSLNKNEYFVCSMHREENVDNARNLESILQALNLVVNEFALPIVVSTHPRTKLRLEKMGEIKKNPQILFLKPFGFFDYVRLQKNSFCVISDSGSISEEAAILSFPAITIRNAMERPEAMDSGNIVLTGLDPQRIIDSIRLVTEERENLKLHPIPAEYTIENTSQRVVKLIIGTAKLAHRWDGVDKNTE